MQGDVKPSMPPRLSMTMDSCCYLLTIVEEVDLRGDGRIPDSAPDGACPGPCHLRLTHGSSMVSSYWNVETDDEIRLNLLQERLNALGTGVRIVMA